MRLIDTIRKIRKSFSGYNPSVRVLISKTNLLYNLNEYKKHCSHFLFAPVLKSNAYGHGIDLIARACQKIKAVDWVATIGDEEAWRVRQAGCRKPILVLSYYDPHSIILRHIRKIRLPLYNKEQALILNQRNLGIPLHLKINTGTSRLGLKPDEVLNFIAGAISYNPNNVEAILINIRKICLSTFKAQVGKGTQLTQK